MGLTIADTYYLKAKAATSGYCSDWEEVCESLNYALSYDEHHCASLCLLGEIYADQLLAPEKAFECFDKIMTIDTHYVAVYYAYIKYLIWYKQTERAKKLVTFALTITTIDKAQIYWLSSYVKETLDDFNGALKDLKKAKKYIYNDHYMDFINDEEKRIKKKIKPDNKEQKTKKSKKGKKKKK